MLSKKEVGAVALANNIGSGNAGLTLAKDNCVLIHHIALILVYKVYRIPKELRQLSHFLPLIRTGPTSRLLKRQSLGPPAQQPAPLSTGRTPPSFLMPPPSSTKAANLERSLQLLDSALGSPTTGQFNLSGVDVTRMVDVTRPFQPIGRQATASRFERSLLLGGPDVTRMNQSVTTLMSNAALLEENPGVRATEALFDEFLTTVSAAAASSAGGGSVEASLDSIAEFEQMVADQVDVLR